MCSDISLMTTTSIHLDIHPALLFRSVESVTISDHAEVQLPSPSLQDLTLLVPACARRILPLETRMIPHYPPLHTTERLLQVNPPTNIEGRTGDVIPIDNEVADSASHFLGFAHATQRYLGQDSLHGFLRDRFVHL